MKSVFKLFVLFFILLPAYTGCSFEKSPVAGNYQVIEERIPIADYSEIEINLPAEVIYQQHSDSLPYLQINTDDNILSHLNIRVENNRLIVEAKPDSIISPTKLTIYTTSTSLAKVKINGSGDLRLAGEVNSPDLALAITGSGEIRTDSLLCDKLRIDLNGTGKVALTGAAGTSFLNVNGAGNIDMSEYFSEKIESCINGVTETIES